MLFIAALRHEGSLEPKSSSSDSSQHRADLRARFPTQRAKEKGSFNVHSMLGELCNLHTKGKHRLLLRKLRESYNYIITNPVI